MWNALRRSWFYFLLFPSIFFPYLFIQVNYCRCSRAEICFDTAPKTRNYIINYDKSKWRQSAAAAAAAGQDKCALRFYERKRCDSILQPTTMVHDECLRRKKRFPPKCIGRLRGSVVFIYFAKNIRLQGVLHRRHDCRGQYRQVSSIIVLYHYKIRSWIT